MLDVKDDHLVVEEKGIYSIENFLMARRLMSWQVYLHKASVAYERMLIAALLRAKELAAKGTEVFASPALRFFLYNDINRDIFYSRPECLENFIQLDDNDIWTSLKVWCNHPDKVLSTLSAGMVNRRLAQGRNIIRTGYRRAESRTDPTDQRNVGSDVRRSHLFHLNARHRKEHVRPGR